MASSALIDIADAVVAELNTAVFSLPFTAERVYVPSLSAQELGTLKVVVVPRSEEGTIANRNATQHEYTVDVGILTKVAQPTPVQIDPLMLLAQEIGDYFRFRTLAGRTERWLKTEVRTPYSPEHVEQQRQFLAVLSVTFTGLRS